MSESRDVCFGTTERYTADRLEELFIRLGLEVPNLPRKLDLLEEWSLEPEVVLVLLEIIRRDKPLNIVEVGAMKGDSTLRMAEVASVYGGRVYAIEEDPTRSSEIVRRSDAATNSVRVVQKSSVKAFEDWGREPIDLIIIDADHSFVPQFVDVAIWSSLLSPGGWLVIHDTLTRLERRFPDDYFSAPFLFDIVDFVGLKNRLSSKPWQGVAFARWAELFRPSVFRRHES
ncbi:MAG: class I SAM-dependent methyltransferase [Candidatus Thiodiazotropha endolucinida]